ncbi:hypothetical protein [Methanobrevibacter curvatus]|uniref:Uncharacterized protein n=1 Tax=Methanobrevibacter curvatus TaxID=49547 RepID=A0A162FGN8_9EURY|nr:hypothetical protein [Methanobrevibacter curvatus]KZX12775.1 hypothetical protein MBCUR_09180 [Methanobrevibacter curvatus]
MNLKTLKNKIKLKNHRSYRNYRNIHLNYENQGFLSLYDVLIGIVLIFLIISIFNIAIDINFKSPSEEKINPQMAQDIIELMSSKTNAKEESLLEIVSYNLESNNYSYESRENVNLMIENFLNKTTNKNYLLLESNILNNTVLSSKGNFNQSQSISTSTREVGNFSYTLYIYD